MVELAAGRTKARFDVAETLAVRQLRESHREILIPTGQIFQIATTTVAGYAFLKFLMGKELNQLGENGTSSIHPALSTTTGKPAKPAFSPFTFQIVFSPKRIYYAESKMLAR